MPLERPKNAAMWTVLLSVEIVHYDFKNNFYHKNIIILNGFPTVLNKEGGWDGNAKWHTRLGRGPQP